MPPVCGWKRRTLFSPPVQCLVTKSFPDKHCPQKIDSTVLGDFLCTPHGGRQFWFRVKYLHKYLEIGVPACSRGQILMMSLILTCNLVPTSD